jgi:hypothetical protein
LLTGPQSACQILDRQQEKLGYRRNRAKTAVLIPELPGTAVLEIEKQLICRIACQK